MAEPRIFDNTRLLREHPGIPHYGEKIVCFASRYEDRSYPADESYFNREFYLILMLAGRSEVRLNGEPIDLEAGDLLIHGADYLTDHLYSSPDIRFITLSLSESVRTDDPFLAQTTAMLLATLRRSRRYTVSLTEPEAQTVRRELEELMALLNSGHRFLLRRIQAACNALFLDVAEFLSRKTVIARRLSRKEHVLQEFHALSLSESVRTDDPFLAQTTAMLLATLRRSRRYTVSLTEPEAQTVRRELEELMALLNSGHRFLLRRIQAACNALFLDVAEFLSRKTVIARRLSRKEHVLQEFHALATRYFREEHAVRFYAGRLAVSEQYLARIVREGTGRSIGNLLGDLLAMEACTLLGSTKHSVGDIALRLGFSDTPGFCKFFRRKTGKTPLGYRKGLRI